MALKDWMLALSSIAAMSCAPANGGDAGTNDSGAMDAGTRETGFVVTDVPMLSLQGMVTCPNGTMCADGEYCVQRQSGIPNDSGTLSTSCVAAPSGCVPVTTTCNTFADCMSLGQDSCPARLCLPTQTQAANGRVVTCQGQ